MLFSETRLEGDSLFSIKSKSADEMGSLRCVISLGKTSLELFTAQMTHIFSYTACIFLRISRSPEISAGVKEVTKEKLQNGIRKAKDLAGREGVYGVWRRLCLVFFSFSSEGNKR